MIKGQGSSNPPDPRHITRSTEVPQINWQNSCVSQPSAGKIFKKIVDIELYGPKESIVAGIVEVAPEGDIFETVVFTRWRL
jgi:hypothetical protein